jgi:hypothetical protein
MARAYRMPSRRKTSSIDSRLGSQAFVHRLKPKQLSTVIEVLAAVAGASITWAAMGSMGFSRRNDEARETVIRLTAGVENIGEQLKILHTDIKAERREMFGRISNVEQRVSKLEGQR